MGFKKFLKKIKRIFKKEKPVIERIFSVYIHKIHIDEHNVILSGSLCNILHNPKTIIKFMFDRLYYTTQIQELIMTSLELQIPIRIICHRKNNKIFQCKNIWQIKNIQSNTINEWILIEPNSKIFI